MIEVCGCVFAKPFAIGQLSVPARDYQIHTENLFSVLVFEFHGGLLLWFV